MSVYFVSDGDYSEYWIAGVFDSYEKACTFKEYHNFDRIEEKVLNPYVLQVEGFLYRASYSISMEELRSVERLGNDNAVSDWVGYLCGPVRDKDRNSMNSTFCSFFADDQEHANKIAGDRVAALKAGSVFIESCSSGQKHYWRVNGTNIEWVYSEDIEA